VRKAVQVCYCRGMPTTFSPLQYRRDRAVIEFKEHVLNGPLIDAINAAVGSATRVRITGSVLDAVVQAGEAVLVLYEPNETLRGALQAAFEAAGFEVVD
jgi:hypothetical protein